MNGISQAQFILCVPFPMCRASLSSLASSCSKSTKSIQICANEQVSACKDVNFENAALEKKKKGGTLMLVSPEF